MDTKYCPCPESAPECIGICAVCLTSKAFLLVPWRRVEIIWRLAMSLWSSWLMPTSLFFGGPRNLLCDFSFGECLWYISNQAHVLSLLLFESLLNSKAASTWKNNTAKLQQEISNTGNEMIYIETIVIKWREDFKKGRLQVRNYSVALSCCDTDLREFSLLQEASAHYS